MNRKVEKTSGPKEKTLREVKALIKALVETTGQDHSMVKRLGHRLE